MTKEEKEQRNRAFGQLLFQEMILPDWEKYKKRHASSKEKSENNIKEK